MKQQILQKSPTQLHFLAQISQFERKLLRQEALKRFPELNQLEDPFQKEQELLHYEMGRTLERYLEKKPLELQKPPDFRPQKSQSQDLAFSALIRLYPQVELPSELAVELETSLPETPKPEDIQATLEALQWDYSRIERSDRPAQEGDLLLVDCYLSQAGEILPQTAKSNQILMLQSDRLPAPWFQALLGAEAGQELNFPVEKSLNPAQPAENPPTLCHLLTKMVARAQVARLDENLAKKAGFPSLDALLEATAQALSDKKQAQWVAEIKEKIVQTLVSKSQVELPDEWLDEELQRACENSDLQHLKAFNLPAQTLKTLKTCWLKTPELRARKADILKTLLVLRAIIQQKGLKVEASEIDAALETLVNQKNQSPSERKQKMLENHTLLFLAERILIEKVATVLMQESRIICQGQILNPN